MKTVFLDFDGVLFDSVKEAYLLTRFAYKGIEIKTPIDKSEYSKFRKYRYLITKSWHFYYIFKLISNNVSDNEFERKYYEYMNNAEESLASEFDEKYVKARKDLMKSDFEFWDNLDSPFEFFFEIKELAKDKNYKFIILTNKKRLPVKNKLEKYSLSAKLFANEELQNFSSKGEFIQKYMKNNKIKKCYFVDDSTDNINSCLKYNNIKCVLAGWGYINPAQNGYSKEEVIEILKKGDIL